tara:strand:+ start:67 stop:462 length:396 start_codon:yes stop_codon:yes gene_type:complete
MLTREQLQGVLLSGPKATFTITYDERHTVGYAVRVGVYIRGKMDFLVAVQRSLFQQGIESKLKDVESKTRRGPILSIRGFLNCNKLCELVPNLPDAKGQWKDFITVVEICRSGKHQTQIGIDELFRIRGLE